jgi:hypothetical protein
MAKSDLPFGSEFSPTQIDLRSVLENVHQHGGNPAGYQRAIRVHWEPRFIKNGTSDQNRRTLIYNHWKSVRSYGIADEQCQLTELGERMYDLRLNAEALYTEFARHILKNLHGTTMVQCILDMQAGAETVDLEKLRDWLAERGISFPRGGKHPSIMRRWLEQARVFVTGWRVDDARFREVLGVSTQEVERLARLTPEQRTYLKTLCNMPGPGPYLSNDIEELASATYGTKFSEKNLPKTVLYPLSEAGLIKLERGTKADGRGAKPFKVKGTEKLQAEVLGPLLAQLEQQIDSDIRPLLRRPLEGILADLKADNKHTRGLALEALAFKLMRLIDLTYVATRLRGAATGGAEVDVIFESTRLVFSRWQVQCKNTERVSLDDVAKEVGLVALLKSNVIVIVGTGEVGAEARKYANKVMADTNLCIVIVNGQDLAQIQASPASIVNVFHREAKHAMKIKALEV